MESTVDEAASDADAIAVKYVGNSRGNDVTQSGQVTICLVLTVESGLMPCRSGVKQ